MIYLRKLEEHIFYYAWMVGFFMYGSEIFLRAIYPITPLVNVLVILSLNMFLFGAWRLRPTKTLTYIILMNYFAWVLFGAFFYLVPVGYGSIRIIGSTLLYLPVAISILYNRIAFGRNADKLIIGWFLLWIANVFVWEEWSSDLFAIFAKVVIIFGILDYEFLIVTQRVREILVESPLSITSSLKEGGGLMLVITKDKQASLMKISEWVKDRVDKNCHKNLETNLIVLQDVIPYKILRQTAWIKPEKVHIIVFSQNPREIEDFRIFKMRLVDIGAVLTETIRRHSEDEGEIILADLTIMIHSFGVQQVYNFLLEKMGNLRSSAAKLVALFHPECHEEWVFALFKSIADDILYF